MTDVDWVGGVCRRGGHVSTSHNGKLYILGGDAAQILPSRFNLQTPVMISDSYLRILDFTKSFTTNSSSSTVETILRLPDNVPRITWGNLFPSPLGKLYYFGGQPSYHPVLTENAEGNTGNIGRGSLQNKIWTFDIAEGRWTETINQDLVGEKPTGYAILTNDPDSGTAWMFGGTYERIGYYTFGPATAPDSLGPVIWTSQGSTPDGQGRIRELKSEYRQLRLSGNSSASVATFQAVSPPPLDPETMHAMRSVYLPRTNTTGIVVVLGGARTVSETHPPFREAIIFDPATNEWYIQPLTAENNNFPVAHWEFCSVVAAAPDGSSWSIYVYGGVAATTTTTTEILQDLYILTIPGFHWIHVGSSFGQVYQHTCDRVGKDDRYMAVYRGIGLGGIPGECTKNADEAGGLRIFDLVDLQWTKTYTAGQKFEVPQKVVQVIGGSGSGGATMLAPKGGFSNPKLASLFNYEPTTSTSTTPPNATQTNDPNNSSNTSSNKPSSRAGLIGGIVGGLLFILLIIAVAIYFLRRRRARQRIHSNRTSELQPTENNATEMPSRRWIIELPAGHILAEMYAPPAPAGGKWDGQSEAEGDKEDMKQTDTHVVEQANHDGTEYIMPESRRS